MTKNVGTADRVLRVVLGLALVSLFFVLEGAARWFDLIGIVLLLTAMVGSCPAYSVFGIRTCRLEDKRA